MRVLMFSTLQRAGSQVSGAEIRCAKLRKYADKGLSLRRLPSIISALLRR